MHAHHHDHRLATGRSVPTPVPTTPVTGLQALQRSAGNAALCRWIGETRNPTTVQRNYDWKNTPTKKALKGQKTLAPNDPLVHSLHHIVPKSMLEDFAHLLHPAQMVQVVNALRPHAPTAITMSTGSYTQAGVPADAVAKALKNLPANFVLGPDPRARADDPGAQPDYNYADDGSITPRSEELGRVYEFIRSKIASGAQVPTTELVDEFITPLVTASRLHNARARSGPIDPNRATWSGDPAQGNARRIAPPGSLLD
ncbi:hypothetical protein GCM10009610_54000 [Pseudonocardia xinjiangensis]